MPYLIFDNGGEGVLVPSLGTTSCEEDSRSATTSFFPSGLLRSCMLCHNPVPSTTLVVRSNGSDSSLVESLDVNFEICEFDFLLVPITDAQPSLLENSFKN